MLRVQEVNGHWSNSFMHVVRLPAVDVVGPCAYVDPYLALVPVPLSVSLLLLNV